jgi:hypothetical protein
VSLLKSILGPIFIFHFQPRPPLLLYLPSLLLSYYHRSLYQPSPPYTMLFNSKFIAALLAIPGATSSNAADPIDPSNLSLYAYGRNISGLTVFYGDGMDNYFEAFTTVYLCPNTDNCPRSCLYWLHPAERSICGFEHYMYLASTRIFLLKRSHTL